MNLMKSDLSALLLEFAAEAKLAESRRFQQFYTEKFCTENRVFCVILCDSSSSTLGSSNLQFRFGTLI